MCVCVCAHVFVCVCVCMYCVSVCTCEHGDCAYILKQTLLHVNLGIHYSVDSINILRFFKCVCVCLSMRVCNGSEEFGGWEYSSDARPSYLLYPVLCVRDNKQRHLGSSS